MAEPSLQDYRPLGLTFRDNIDEDQCSGVIGSVACARRGVGASFDVSLVVKPDWTVFAGDERSPDQPIRFVNSTLGALAKFIEAHAQYTDDTLDRCQLDERSTFKSLFVSRIVVLIAQLRSLDAAALADRECWWPYTIDRTQLTSIPTTLSGAAMIRDTDMCQRLNLVRTSGSFVVRETGDLGEAEVLSVKVVAKGQGICWVGGTSILKSGRDVESVFRVDTDSGGTLVSVYWWIGGNWYEHDDADALTALGLSRDQVFPFDWRFCVALEEDIFHDT